MKYTYAYKTSDGKRHEAAMDAESREAVFSSLRAKGIKAIKIVAADGSKANGEIRGVRKRFVAVLGALCFVLGAVAFLFIRNPNDSPRLSELALESTMRRQVIGDAAIIDKGLRTGWAHVFLTEGERFLASFAVPGVPAGVGSTTEQEFAEALKRHIEIDEDDGIETRQIKSMVMGMKQEAERFIAQGGSVQQYCKLLVQRQNEEIGYYTRAKAEIENAQKSKIPAAQLNELWEKRNESLRQMGIKLITMPE